MAEPYFQFRQFRVYHQKSAFKVGTDSVLLGAWAPVKPKMRVLDIGTGSGLIALLMAQRGASEIDAIDIHAPSVAEAARNFMRSPYGGLQSHQANFEHWKPINGGQYDLIVSNPPYFTKSTPAANMSKHAARHTDSLSPTLLFEKASSLLKPNGKLSLIFPEREEPLFKVAAAKAQLFPNRICRVIPQPNSPSNRLMVCYGPVAGIIEREDLIIAFENRSYTSEYKELVLPYLLRV